MENNNIVNDIERIVKENTVQVIESNGRTFATKSPSAAAIAAKARRSPVLWRKNAPLTRKLSSSTPFSKMRKRLPKSRVIGSSGKCASSSTSCCVIRAF